MSVASWFYARPFYDRYFDDSRVYIRWGYCLTLLPLVGFQPYAYWSLDRSIAVPFSIAHFGLAIAIGVLVYLTYVSKNGLRVYVISFIVYAAGGTTLNLAALLNSTPTVTYITAGHMEALLMFAVAVRAPWLATMAYGLIVICLYAYIVLFVWEINALDASIIAFAVVFILLLVVVGSYARDRQTFELYKTQDSIKALESENARWNMMLTQFLRHELSNQIAGITTSFQMLAREQVGNSERYTHRGIRSVEELKELLSRVTAAMNIDDLLDNLDLEPINLAELVRELVVDYEGHLPERKALTVIDASNSDNGSILVRGDYLLLKQALRNVVDNALRHSSPGENVEIVLGGGGTVEVVDRGDPLPDDIERIFSFGVASGSKKAGLYGLGLYLARKILIAHGGTIFATQADGFSGAVFTINLPHVEMTV